MLQAANKFHLAHPDDDDGEGERERGMKKNCSFCAQCVRRFKNNQVKILSVSDLLNDQEDNDDRAMIIKTRIRGFVC